VLLLGSLPCSIQGTGSGSSGAASLRAEALESGTFCERSQL
jgi:hypothetical protein